MYNPKTHLRKLILPDYMGVPYLTEKYKGQSRHQRLDNRMPGGVFYERKSLPVAA